MKQELRDKYGEIKRQAEAKEKLQKEEEEVRRQLERRQQQLLGDKKSPMESAVLIVSMIRIIVVGLRIIESMIRKLDDINLQDPMLLLRGEPHNVSCPTLFQLRTPRVIEQEYQRKFEELEKNREAVSRRQSLSQTNSLKGSSESLPIHRINNIQKV